MPVSGAEGATDACIGSRGFRGPDTRGLFAPGRAVRTMRGRFTDGPRSQRHPDVTARERPRSRVEDRATRARIRGSDDHRTPDDRCPHPSQTTDPDKVGSPFPHHSRARRRQTPTHPVPQFDLVLSRATLIDPPTETWPSGRRHTPAKGADGKPSRGFESLRLRQRNNHMFLLIISRNFPRSSDPLACSFPDRDCSKHHIGARCGAASLFGASGASLFLFRNSLRAGNLQGIFVTAKLADPFPRTRLEDEQRSPHQAAARGTLDHI